MIPILVGGGLLLTGILGATGHSMAKETNEEAQQIGLDAKKMYDTEKEVFENIQKSMEKSLLEYGNTKKECLDNSIAGYIKAYEKMRQHSIENTIEVDGLKDFLTQRDDINQFKSLSDGYAEVVTSGLAGAATGATIALAVSGAMPFIGSSIATAGSLVTLGEFGMAASLVGSTLSFGAMLTPLSAVIAPTLFFSGISASMKADDNLEKANVMFAEAKEAVEKMKVSETICKGVMERSDMFNDLLIELNNMFLPCTKMFNSMLDFKLKRKKGEKLTQADFTYNEEKFIKSMMALERAIKTVLEVPILNEDGSLSIDAENKYQELKGTLPVLKDDIYSLETLKANISRI